MASDTTASDKAHEALAQGVLAEFDKIFGLHPGFRPAHAKGAMCHGTFVPSAAAATLTRAPHANRVSTPVLVRFSDSTGIPTIPDNDAHASPRGCAIRFVLGDHKHTDIVAHSYEGFPTRTGEEFLELLTALASTGPDSPHPNPVEQFLGGHPHSLPFVTAPNPLATSFAHESFFAVSAFQFSDAGGKSRFGRFRIFPEAGNEYLDAAQGAGQSTDYLFAELNERLAAGPIKFRIMVQLAEEGDVITDATVKWPETREQVEFGTISVTSRADDADPEMKKVIFDPIPRVDGIDSSDNPLFTVRSAVYLMSGRRRRAASH
jgi:catalase